MTLFATAPKGVVPLLARELQSLGAIEVSRSGSGCRFSGDLALAYRVCLWSRLANRVLLPLARFPAATGEALYAGVLAIPWESHLAPDGTLAVDCTATDAAIGHSHFAALKTKDAVVDRFRECVGRRPSVDVVRPDLRINLHLRRSEARVSIDLSGGSLHRRGYRIEGAKAPLKENLAAAILMLSEWPAIAARGGSLFDPMCGSGTLLIEGALMAADSPPGLTREHFGFLGWLGHQPEAWEALLAEARERHGQGLGRIPAIVGHDADPEALKAARANARRAGLEGRIRLEQHRLEEPLTMGAGQPGLLVTNPPMGSASGR